MDKNDDRGLRFCHELHRALGVALADSRDVRARVEALRPQNSFAESCFCKGCVLPIVDTVATRFLREEYGCSRYEVHNALRCEGFDTPMYVTAASQAGFSSHSRSNSFHPGDKSGRRSESRRSPDFCIRSSNNLRMLGELKYVSKVTAAIQAQVIHEIRDYLSIVNELTSDWGHDFGFGLIYGFGGSPPLQPIAVLDLWESDRIFLSVF